MASNRDYQDSKFNWNDVIEHPDNGWDFNKLSLRTDFDWNLLKYNNLWKMFELSYNVSLTWKIVKDNINLNWNWYNLSFLQDIDLKFVIEHDYEWNIKKICSNPKINWKIVLSNHEYKWDFNALSSNTSLSLEYVCKYPFLPWKWEYVERTLFSKYNS